MTTINDQIDVAQGICLDSLEHATSTGYSDRVSGATVWIEGAFRDLKASLEAEEKYIVIWRANGSNGYQICNHAEARIVIDSINSQIHGGKSFKILAVLKGKALSLKTTTTTTFEEAK